MSTSGMRWRGAHGHAGFGDVRAGGDRHRTSTLIEKAAGRAASRRESSRDLAEVTRDADGCVDVGKRAKSASTFPVTMKSGPSLRILFAFSAKHLQL